SWSANDGLPPEVREPLSSYLDAAGTKSIAILPLNAVADSETNPEPTGVLVAEQFSNPMSAPVRERLQLVAEQSAAALGNANRFRQAPWSALLGEARWQRLTRGRSRIRLWLGAAA